MEGFINIALARMTRARRQMALIFHAFDYDTMELVATQSSPFGLLDAERVAPNPTVTNYRS